jgi:hypothetical protein
MRIGRVRWKRPYLLVFVWAVTMPLACAPGASGQTTEVWRGAVSSPGPDAESIDIEVRLAAGGNPVFAYDTRQGPQEVELTERGQMVRFVPPGGGVRTITVSEIDASQTQLRLSLDMTFEKTAGGVLEQTRGTSTTILVRDGDTIQATIVVQSGTRLSDSELAVGGGEPKAVTYSGVLRRHTP